MLRTLILSLPKDERCGPDHRPHGHRPRDPPCPAPAGPSPALPVAPGPALVLCAPARCRRARVAAAGRSKLPSAHPSAPTLRPGPVAAGHRPARHPAHRGTGPHRGPGRHGGHRHRGGGRPGDRGWFPAGECVEGGRRISRHVERGHHESALPPRHSRNPGITLRPARRH